MSSLFLMWQMVGHGEIGETFHRNVSTALGKFTVLHPTSQHLCHLIHLGRHL